MNEGRQYYQRLKEKLWRKILNTEKINSAGKLTHLQADDLFDNSAVQVFAAKTGQYLGTIYKGNPINFEESQDEPQPIQEPPTPKAQLKLF